MTDLVQYAGQHIEVELEGRRFRGRVVRGAGRKAILLEDLGTVGEKRSDIHKKLQMSKTWTSRQLREARVIQILNGASQGAPKKQRTPPPWNEIVLRAEGDPANPPADWEGGLLAWAESVYAARRKVDRSRKAMMEALREAAT